MELPPWAEAETGIVHQWVKWVYGACVLEFVRRRWALPVVRDGWRVYVNGKAVPFTKSGQESPLLAMLAALDTSPKEAGQ